MKMETWLGKAGPVLAKPEKSPEELQQEKDAGDDQDGATPDGDGDADDPDGVEKGSSVAASAAGEPSGKPEDVDTSKVFPSLAKGGPGSGIQGHTTSPYDEKPAARRSQLANNLTSHANMSSAEKPYGGMNLTGKAQMVARHQEAAMHHTLAMNALPAGHQAIAQHAAHIGEHHAASARVGKLSPEEHEAVFHHMASMTRNTDDMKEKKGYHGLAAQHAQKLVSTAKTPQETNRWTGNAQIHQFGHAMGGATVTAPQVPKLPHKEVAPGVHHATGSAPPPSGEPREVSPGVWRSAKSQAPGDMAKGGRGTSSGTEHTMKPMEAFLRKSGIPGATSDTSDSTAGAPQLPNTRTGSGGDGINADAGMWPVGEGRKPNTDLPESSIQIDQSMEVNGGLSTDPPGGGESLDSPGLHEHMGGAAGDGSKLAKTDPSGKEAGVPETTGTPESAAGKDSKLSPDDGNAGEMPDHEPRMTTEENAGMDADNGLETGDPRKKPMEVVRKALDAHDVEERGRAAHIRSDQEGARMFALHKAAMVVPDVFIGPPARAATELRKSEDQEPVDLVKSINGVQYSDASDRAVDAFLNHRAETGYTSAQGFDVTNGLQKSIMCKSCGGAISAVLSKCNHCGSSVARPMVKSVALPAEVQRLGPVLRELDIKIE